MLVKKWWQDKLSYFYLQMVIHVSFHRTQVFGVWQIGSWFFGGWLWQIVANTDSVQKLTNKCWNRVPKCLNSGDANKQKSMKIFEHLYLIYVFFQDHFQWPTNGRLRPSAIYSALALILFKIGVHFPMLWFCDGMIWCESFMCIRDQLKCSLMFL